MRSLLRCVPTESFRQPAISTAIGMHHQDHAPGSVEAHGFADLIEDELTIRLMLRRSHDFGASGNLDGIRIGHANTLEELAESQLKAIVEAPEDGGVAMIFFTRSIEVEYFFHENPLSKDPLASGLF